MTTLGNAAYLDGTGFLDVNGNWTLVSAANPLPTTGGGGGGGGAVTIADGADVTQGSEADAAYTTGSGTVVSVLKGIFGKFSSVVLGAGSAIIGKVGIDQTTPGTTNAIALSTVGASAITLGSKTSANSLPVVIASDNNVNTVAAQAARTTGTITTSSGVVSTAVSAYSIVTVTFNGTYAGITVNFEYSDDGGTTWYGVFGTPSNSITASAASVVLGTNATVAYNVTIPGVTNFRVRASAYTSGTLNVGITPTGDPMVFNVAAGIVGTPAVNVAQINGVTTLTGNGTTGTGSPRVTIASDNTAFSVNALGAAVASAVPATAFYQGVNPQTALPTAATTGQLTGMLADKFGRVATSPYGPRGVIGSTTTTITASTTATTIIAAVASQFSDIVMLVLTNTSATATTAILSDGTNSYELYVPATDVRGFTTGVILPATSANVAWTVQCGTSITSLFITAIYIKNQ